MTDKVLDEVNALINFFEGDEMMDEDIVGLMDICQNLSAQTL